MLLAADVGNTNIKLGIFKGKNLIFHTRLTTDRMKTVDEYAVELHAVFQIYKIDIMKISGVIISSVVPQVTFQLKESLSVLTGVEPIVVGPGVKTGLNIKIDNPATLGADLAVGCAAAIDMFECPCIVIGLGTATTFSVIDRSKAMRGGSILPGVSVSLNALTNSSSLLPAVGFEPPKKVVGTNTEDCIRSGSILGTASLIDGMCDRIEAELGEKCTVVATGGLSNMIIPCCKRRITICENLIMEGLRIIYEKNK